MNVRPASFPVLHFLAALVLTSISGYSTAGMNAAGSDRIVAGRRAYPIARDPTEVGRFPPHVKSGGGYFYDHVLEYRVWMHPDDGAEKKNGNDVYYRAFAQYERALEFSKRTKGSEEPLVLIRQLKYIDEPKSGVFKVYEEDRLTEWQVEWLAGSKRLPGSIEKFMLKHRK